ncbi:hypothetical protein L596_019568 [Steinernema carpocapsae]|uniref:Uncharacterized protein n=1 Tax=Steinernema carpocapsae TaxID=34508 RepID=A0A4U5MQW3_STECR|nr:hypothetical protein L596_019568 [Steinernema carpocapsae]
MLILLFRFFFLLLRFLAFELLITFMLRTHFLQRIGVWTRIRVFKLLSRNRFGFRMAEVAGHGSAFGKRHLISENSRLMKERGNDDNEETAHVHKWERGVKVQISTLQISAFFKIPFWFECKQKWLLG